MLENSRTDSCSAIHPECVEHKLTRLIQFEIASRSCGRSLNAVVCLEFPEKPYTMNTLDVAVTPTSSNTRTILVLPATASSVNITEKYEDV